jgi:hypothetical protein
MSLKESRNWLQQQRVDQPDLKALDSSIIYDFQMLVRGFVNNEPYILRGFNIPVTGINGPATALQVVVDSAVVWVPANKDGSFLRVDPGTANETLSTSNSKVVGAFAPNQANYLGVRFKRASDPNTSDLVSFWDVDAQVEFTKTVPRGLVLNYEFVISTTDFGDTAPIAVIQTNLSNNVTSIKNAKRGLFRLGSGGASPSPSNELNVTPATENNLTATSPSDPDPFAGGDWELDTFKDWMDFVMSQIKRITGSSFWYSNGSSSLTGVNLTDTWNDALGSLLTGSGIFKHSATTPGLLDWTTDLYIRSIVGPRAYTIKQGSTTLANGEVLYLNLQRNLDFQPANTFTFTSGSTTVTAALTITGIQAGDWIKSETHSDSAWRRVATVSGTTITLSTAYPTTSASAKASKCVGVYSLTPGPGEGTIAKAAPQSVPSNADVYWIAKRDDNALASATVTNIQRTSDLVTITTSAPHSFSVGQTISLSGLTTTILNGTFEIETVPSATTFTFILSGPNIVSTPDSGTASMPAKIYLRSLGEVDQGEDRQIDDNQIVNMLKFIGARSETDTQPQYWLFPNSLATYSITTSDSLVDAISKIIGNLNSVLTTLDQPSYDESYLLVASSPGPGEILGPITSGSNIQIPVNSRLIGTPQQYYVVGKGAIEVYLNGQYLQLGVDWIEVGPPNTDSDTIQIQQNLVVGDRITFRLDANGGPGSGGSSAPDDNFVTLPTSPTADNADYILIYDVSAAAYRRQLRSTFLSGVGGNLTVTQVSTNYTALVTDDVILVNATGGTVTVTLPPASGNSGKVYQIKKIDSSSNTVVIDGNGSETIDDALTLTTTVQYEAFTIVCDGTEWWII